MSNNNSTATRSFNEFNHGLVLSATPLEDNVLFEVRIDQKVILIFQQKCSWKNKTKYLVPNTKKNFSNELKGVVMEWKYRSGCYGCSPRNGTSCLCHKNDQWNLGMNFLKIFTHKNKENENLKIKKIFDAR